jgi:multidrug efflux pump
MARFFIDRPIFAWVIAIIVMLAGVLSILKLPVSQYPSIAPPTVVISASYPGANAKTMEDTVTQVIEQRMTGIDNLRYLSSTSDSFGNTQITLTFNAEADPDIAQVQVQNKLQSALPLLPMEVQQQGVKVNKASSSFLMVVGFYVFYNGKQASGIGIKLATGANALATAEAVKAKIDELKPFFPEGLQAVYPYDTTPFVEKSIEGVVHTLFEAVALVFIIMFLFLQNFRATLIPTIAVPVVLLGTFAVLSIAGYSINTLTMFAMVLAIGLLVDDAIVVVENVERVMHEEGLSPVEATRKSMDQITGALVGIALTLSAVFVPMAFMSGSTGVIYRQFSITIVTAMSLSVMVAVILTPALCATMLKPVAHGSNDKGFFGWFNRTFDNLTKRYESSVAAMIKRSIRVMFIFLGLTVAVMDQVSDYYLTQEADSVASVFSVSGFSFAGNGQNMGMAFVGLKDWSDRQLPGMDVKSIVNRSMGYFQKIKNAMVFSFAPPAVIELGTASGFDFYLQDRSGQGHEKLIAARNQLLQLAAENPNLVGVRPNGQEDAPMYQINIDQAKIRALGIDINSVNKVLGTAWGSSYVNDFIDRGRVKKVFVQGDAQYRMKPGDLDTWYVRNNLGEMVPFSAFATGEWQYASPRLERFNATPAVNIQGSVVNGYSTGQAMLDIEAMVKKLPPGYGVEWNGLSYEERLSGNQAPMLYALSILVVFLVLAALYESWSVPFAVVLVVPLGIIGALVAMNARGMPNDVFFQVGLLTTVGLATKNAILIVEFAKEYYEKGAGLVEATLHAVRVRLRPIIMTSLAFGLGVVPLAISTGVGSGGKNAIGTAVLGGMLSSTFLGIFFIPIFFVVVERIFSRGKDKSAAESKPPQH